MNDVHRDTTAQVRTGLIELRSFGPFTLFTLRATCQATGGRSRPSQPFVLGMP
jgi:hypothetical protein